MGFFQYGNKQPLSAYVDRGSVRIGDTLRKRYAENFAAADELQAQLDTLNSTNFEGDLALKEELMNSTRTKLDQLASRGDYENLSLAVAKSGRDFQKQYAPLKENYDRYQAYIADVQKKYDEGLIDAETYQSATAASSHNYGGLRINEYGNVDSDSYFKGMNLVKDVNIAELVNEAAKGIVPDSERVENAMVSQGPNGEFQITTKSGIKTIPPERVQALYNEVISRPDVKAALAQKAKLRTYNLTDEDKAANLAIDIENNQKILENYQQELMSDDLSAEQKLDVKLAMNQIQKELDSMMEMQQAGTDLTTYSHNREINNILSPIYSGVMAKHQYMQTENSQKVDWDKRYMEILRSDLAEQRQLRKEQRELDTGIISVTGPNTLEFVSYNTYEKFDDQVKLLEDQYKEIDIVSRNAEGNYSDEQVSNANATKLRLRNDIMALHSEMEALYEEARRRDPELREMNYGNLNWYTELSHNEREAMREVAEDESSERFYYKRSVQPEYITAGDQAYNKFEKDLKENVFKGGIPTTLKGYEVDENGIADIGSDPIETLGDTYKGAEVADIAIASSGTPGSPSSGEMLLLTLKGGEENVHDGKQLVVPMTQFRGSDFYNNYVNGTAYKLSKRMNQVRINPKRKASFDADITVYDNVDVNPPTTKVQRVTIEMNAEGASGDEVKIIYPDGTPSKVMSLEEAINSSFLADNNILNVNI